jgi:hypothetical protein
MESIAQVLGLTELSMSRTFELANQLVFCQNNWHFGDWDPHDMLDYQIVEG